MKDTAKLSWNKLFVHSIEITRFLLVSFWLYCIACFSNAFRTYAVIYPKIESEICATIKWNILA